MSRANKKLDPDVQSGRANLFQELIAAKTQEFIKEF